MCLNQREVIKALKDVILFPDVTNVQLQGLLENCWSYPIVFEQKASKRETFSSFNDLLAKSDKPVLVDFYATWCALCQFMVPIMNEVSVALNDKIEVLKIDTEKYPSIANKYRIEALQSYLLSGESTLSKLKRFLLLDRD